MSNYHVSKYKESGKWRVKKEGADRSSGYGKTQREGEYIAKGFAKKI